LKVRDGSGHTLRRRAVDVRPAAEPGWDLVAVKYSSVLRLAEDVATHGADVVALEPEELRKQVIAWLRDVAGEQP
jgi:predicted DNA-binding transcriptional regulator YafY